MPRRALHRPGPGIAVALVGVVVAIAGCGPSTADTVRGRQLFLAKCAQCHTLAEAGSNGLQGPNLDAAFAQARANGMNAATIEGIVKMQVAHPRPITSNPSVSMPANLVSGQDLDDVAAYVASVAGVPGIKPPQVPGGQGGQLFVQNNCSGCHTLAAANASGTTGPNLDQVIPGMSASQIIQSIADPNAKITPGYPANVMPNFGQTLSSGDIKLLAKFLTQYAGKPGSSAGAAPSATGSTGGGSTGGGSSKK